MDDGIAANDSAIGTLNTAVQGKVDKVEGKGLSTNDFTDADALKLAGIEDGAEVNVQADWDEGDNTADDYIKNKPDLSVYAEKDALWQDATASGNPVTIKTQSAQNAKQTILTMAPIQSGSGTPAPDNVRPISGRTQAEIDGCGANVMDDNLVSGSLNQVTYTVNEDKSITVNGTASTTSNFPLFTDTTKINLLKGQTYYIGHNDPTSNVEIQVYVNGVFFNYTDGTKKAITIPSAATSSYARLRVGSGLTVNNARIYPMIALHDYTEWEAPKPKTSVTIPFGSTIYGGTLNVETGELTVEYMCKEFDGTEEITNVSSGANRFYRFVPNFGVETRANNIYGCSHFENAQVTTSTTYIGCDVYFSTTEQQSYIQFRPNISGVTDVDTFKAWLAAQYANGTPVQVFSKLRTPTTTTLTAAQVNLLKGLNNVSTDADGISLTYFADGESLTDADNRITAVLGDFATVEGARASQNYSVGDYLIFSDKFCKASAAIATGEVLAIGTNLTQTTIGAELKAILAQL